MCGNIERMSDALAILVSNAKTFDDKLTAYSLYVKLYGATSKYGDAVSLALNVLSTLGEEFPQDISSCRVSNDLSTIQTLFASVTVEQI